MNLQESLTSHFYQWEQRGRGWMRWDEPVDIEPHFIPFFHHSIDEFIHPPTYDDGAVHSVLSFIKSGVKSIFKKRQREDELAPFEEPAPFQTQFRGPLSSIYISFPPDAKTGIHESYLLLQSLASASFPISFEIIGEQGKIYIQLVVPESQGVWVVSLLQSLFPVFDYQVVPVVLSEVEHEPAGCAVFEFGLSQEFMRPLKSYDRSDPDPYIPLISAFETIQEYEYAIFQVFFQGTVCQWEPSILRSVSDGSGGPFFMDAPEMLTCAKDKISAPLVAATMRLMVISNDVPRINHLSTSIIQSIRSITSSAFNELCFLNLSGLTIKELVFDLLRRQSRRYGMLLNIKELGSLVHLPSASLRSEKLRFVEPTMVSVPSSIVGNEYLIGKTEMYTTEEISLTIKQRLRHMHVIGATGTGKSTLLLNLLIQDIQKGNGVAVLDPHGDLIDTLIQYIPEHRHQDVIIFDPAKEEYAPGINLLNAHSEMEKVVLASDLTAMFKRHATSWGDQMNAILANAINAFLESNEGGTLIELKRFLVEPKFRNTFLKTIDDEHTRYFWEHEFPHLRKNAFAPLLTRLDSFLRPKVVRNIIGQKEGLNFHQILNTRKILLVKLAQGLIGEENAYLLGTLISAKLFQAAQARQAIDMKSRHPFFLYFDEFQNFVVPSMEAMLSGARKFGLGLILAHQDLQQLFQEDTKVGNSVISNPGIRVCFRVGDLDAVKLEKGFTHFEAYDLQNLSVGEVIMRVDRSDHDVSVSTPLLPQIEDQVALTNRTAILNSAIWEQAVVEDTPLELVIETIQEEDPISEEQEEETLSENTVEYYEQAQEDINQAPESLEKAAEQFKAKERERQRVTEHRRIQELIQKAAQEYGLKAVLEEPVNDPPGKVDVSIHFEKQKIAVEVSVTNTPQYEVKNIQKCLSNGFDRVISCSQDSKHLRKIELLTQEKLSQEELKRVLFYSPQEMLIALQQLIAQQTKSTSKKKIRGYRVKVNYKSPEDKKPK